MMNKPRSRYSNHDFLFVHISLGEISLGIDLKNVKELVNYREITILPGSPAFLEGSIMVRTLSVPVIDLRKRFFLGQEAGPLTRIIIATVDGSIAGFVVDRVKDITSGVKEALLKPDNSCPWNECVGSAIETGKGIVPIINLSMLLTEEEKNYLKAPAFPIS